MYQDYLADDPTCLLILDAGLYIYVLFGLVNPTGILIILYLRRFRMTQDLSISFIKLSELQVYLNMQAIHAIPH
jgi:hypothetical protein